MADGGRLSLDVGSIKLDVLQGQNAGANPQIAGKREKGEGRREGRTDRLKRIAVMLRGTSLHSECEGLFIPEKRWTRAHPGHCPWAGAKECLGRECDTPCQGRVLRGTAEHLRGPREGFQQQERPRVQKPSSHRVAIPPPAPPSGRAASAHTVCHGRTQLAFKGQAWLIESALVYHGPRV